MSVNKYAPHAYIIPEDDANRQIANGFVLHQRVIDRWAMVVQPARGWSRVLDAFEREYVPRLRRNDRAHVVMILDFEGNVADRRAAFNDKIPPDIQLRVFVVGPSNTPESLRQAMPGTSLERIGTLLADDCARDQRGAWGHEQLQHNDDE